MVSFFKEKSPSAIFGIIALSICLHAHFWVRPPQIITNTGDGLLYNVLSPLQVLPSIALAVIYQIIILVQALMLNFFLNDARMFPKPAFTTALAYIVLTSLVPEWNNISTALVANTMLIWLLQAVIKMYNSPSPKTFVYNIGLISGGTVLLYHAAAPLALLVFFATGILRPFRINEWIILVLGLLTPVYFFLGYVFLYDKTAMIPPIIAAFYPHVIHPENILHTIITFLSAGLVIAAGFFVWQRNSGRMLLQIRKYWIIVFIMMLLLIPSVFFIMNTWPAALLLVTVPAAAFVSNAWLYPQRNFVPAIFFWLLVAVAVYNNWALPA